MGIKGLRIAGLYDFVILHEQAANPVSPDNPAVECFDGVVNKPNIAVVRLDLIKS